MRPSAEHVYSVMCCVFLPEWRVACCATLIATVWFVGTACGQDVSPSDMMTTGAIPGVERLVVRPATTQASGDTLLQLEVFINGERTSWIAGFLRQGPSDLLAKPKELMNIGVFIEDEHQSKPWVPLSQLSGLTFHMDEVRQSLHLYVTPSRRSAQKIDARGTSSERYSQKAHADYGLAATYLLHAQAVKDDNYSHLQFNHAAAHLDGRFFSPYGIFYQGGYVTATPDAETRVVRLQSTLEHVDDKRSITYRLGDFIMSSVSWSRPLRMAGLQIERDFESRPDLVTMPLPSVQGTATVPTTVDVYVNNIRTFSTEVKDGPYSIANLPTLVGAGTARVIVRDATGRQTENEFAFFSSSRMLAKGLSDFSSSVGVANYNYGSAKQKYGTSPLGVASFRYGLKDDWTLETHGEAMGISQNAGIGVVTNSLGRVLLNVAVRGSHDEGRVGYAAHAGAQTQLAHVNVAASLQLGHKHFADLATITTRTAPGKMFAVKGVPSTTSAPLQGRLTLSVPIASQRATLGLGYLLTDQQTERTHTLTASVSKALGTRSFLFLNGYTSAGDRRSTGVYAGLSVPLGRQIQASVSATSTSSGSFVSAEAAKPLGEAAGDWGWRARVAQGKNLSQQAVAVGTRTSVARLESSLEAVGQTVRLAAEAEGTVLSMGRGVHASSRSDSTFAVVDVGAPNVPVYHENRFVGVTGRDGTLLVSGLLPYYKNKISLDTTKLPAGTILDKTQLTLTPKANSGVWLRFQNRAGKASGHIILHDTLNRPVRAGYSGVVEATGETFRVGYDGIVFLKDIPLQSDLVVQTLQGPCRAQLRYPLSREASSPPSPQQSRLLCVLDPS